MLGICFGAQILARALGAEVRRVGEPEVGWTTVVRAEPWIPEGRWFFWHEDTFSWPADSTPLAWTAAAPKAVRCASHLGLQFPAEASGDMIEKWLDKGVRKLERTASPLMRCSVRPAAWRPR